MSGDKGNQDELAAAIVRKYSSDWAVRNSSRNNGEQTSFRPGFRSGRMTRCHPCHP